MITGGRYESPERRRVRRLVEEVREQLPPSLRAWLRGDCTRKRFIKERNTDSMDEQAMKERIEKHDAVRDPLQEVLFEEWWAADAYAKENGLDEYLDHERVVMVTDGAEDETYLVVRNAMDALKAIEDWPELFDEDLLPVRIESVDPEKIIAVDWDGIPSIFEVPERGAVYDGWDGTSVLATAAAWAEHKAPAAPCSICSTRWAL